MSNDYYIKENSLNTIQDLGDSDGLESLDAIENLETELKHFGDLRPGDEIVGSDGKSVTVTDVYDKHIPKKMFEIEMEDGEVIQASGNHLWYCESDLDKDFKYNYYKLAKDYFETNVIPTKLKIDEHYPLIDMLHLFKRYDDSINTQLFIEKICKSLGYSSYTPHLMTENLKVYTGKTEVYNYSYNSLIDFMHKMKKAVIDGEGYFYFGEVITTEEIYKLINKGINVNIPHLDELNNKK